MADTPGPPSNRAAKTGSPLFYNRGPEPPIGRHNPVDPLIPPKAIEVQRRALGSSIAALRKERKLTQDALGDMIGYKQPNISKIELGTARVRQAELERIIKALDLTEVEANKLRALLEDPTASQVRAESRLNATPPWFRKIMKMEAGAISICSWTGERLPGQLQCESYMLEQFQAGSHANIDDAIHERTSRARLFDNHPDRSYEYLLSESALERLIRCHMLTPYTVLGQIKHLLALPARHPSVSIRIVAFEDAIYTEPDFTILKYPNADLDLAYIEEAQGAHLSKADQLPPFLEAWDALTSVALTTAATRKLLEQTLTRCQSAP